MPNAYRRRRQQAAKARAAAVAAATTAVTTTPSHNLLDRHIEIEEDILDKDSTMKNVDFAEDNQESCFIPTTTTWHIDAASQCKSDNTFVGTMEASVQHSTVTFTDFYIGEETCETAAQTEPEVADDTLANLMQRVRILEEEHWSVDDDYYEHEEDDSRLTWAEQCEIAYLNSLSPEELQQIFEADLESFPEDPYDTDKEEMHDTTETGVQENSEENHGTDIGGSWLHMMD